MFKSAEYMYANGNKMFQKEIHQINSSEYFWRWYWEEGKMEKIWWETFTFYLVWIFVFTMKMYAWDIN